MSTPVISLDKISMGYRIYRRPIDILKETVLGGMRHDTFWALRDISLEVNEGDRLGIVGPNGAGKSTLLKVICNNLTPTSGRLTVNGRISSLLSLTPAWNEEDNGIENIKFNLMMQGVSRGRIPGIIEDIVDFTELGPFIHQPVKTYSSGMGARLSFAIATATDPDILIIDEVLGTGDGYFAGKATARMKEFCARGRALIFVSHSVAAVQQMCNHAIWMQNGAIRLKGDAEAVIAKYELDYRKAEDEATRAASIARASVVSSAPDPSELQSDAIRLRIVPKGGARFGASYYVREIVVANDGTKERVVVPLTVSTDAKENDRCTLDVLSSEWGRAHDRQGALCRILQRMSGRNPGGHIQLGTGFVHVGPDGRLPFSVSFEVACEEVAEPLELEVLDLKLGRWRPLGEPRVEDADGDWSRYTISGTLELPAGQAAVAMLEKLREENMQPVQIGKVTLRSNGVETYVLNEGEPFSISVEVDFRRRIPIADVGIRLTRNDGVYVFWQSSGMAPVGNLIDVEGKKTVEFLFDENVIGAGEYSVNAYSANGWHFPKNYPYEEVYDRKMNAMSFRINPRLDGLDLGIVARTFEVVVA